MLALRDRLRAGGLTAAVQASGLDVPAIVRDIIAQVQARGDAAVAELEARIDQVAMAPSQFRVPAGAIRSARRGAEPEFLRLVRRVAANIRRYQKSILLKSPPALRRGGADAGRALHAH